MNAEFQTGDVLLSKYRVDGIVGQGGMGFIVRAQHLQLGEPVALKFLRREILGNPEAVRRFMLEARAAIRIKSEHVARVIDVNTLESGEPFIVMEYLEGESLGTWAERTGTLPIQTVVEFTLQICEAIAEAHGLGIVHRDLKPANVFVIRRADGILAAKVLDFGISKVSNAVSATTDKITKDVAMGSPAYCSPEQLQTPQDVDQRADLWSLGVLLYELFGGTLPFQADNTLQLCMKVVHERFEPLQKLRADLPEGLCQAVERCLEKNRDARFSNVGELALALAPYAPQRAKPSVERIVRTVTASGGSLPQAGVAQFSKPETTAPHVLDQLRIKAPRRSRLVFVLSALIAVAVLAGFLLARGLSGRAAPADSASVFVIEGTTSAVGTRRASAKAHPDLKATASSSPLLAVPLPVVEHELPRVAPTDSVKPKPVSSAPSSSSPRSQRPSKSKASTTRKPSNVYESRK